MRPLPLCAFVVALAGIPGVALADDLDGWCAQVKKASSIVICSDVVLRQQAIARNKLFDAARAKLSPEAYKTLTDDQSRWIKTYTARCGVSIDDPPPPMPIPQGVIDCYRRESRARTAYLAEYLSVPNPMASVPASSELAPAASAPAANSAQPAGEAGAAWQCRDPNTNFVYTRPEPCAKGDLVLLAPDSVEQPIGKNQITGGNAGRDEVALVEADGVYKVPVVINGVLPLKFVLDSGAADVSLPEDVFSVLLRTGTLTVADYMGVGNYRLGDGSTVKSDRFYIRELRVGNQVLKHVSASIGNRRGPLLLGQSFLKRFASVEIDNSQHVLALGAERPNAGESAAFPTPPPGFTLDQGPAPSAAPAPPSGAVPLPPDMIPASPTAALPPPFDPTRPYTVVPQGSRIAAPVPIDLSKLKLTDVSLAYGPLLPNVFKFIVANAGSQRVSELTIGYHETPGVTTCTADLADYDGFKKFSADYIGRPLDLTAGDSVVLETQFNPKARWFCIISAR
jgi:uncharacterized protein YecT (DUF1311 family)